MNDRVWWGRAIHNTSGPSMPFAYDELIREDRIWCGELVNPDQVLCSTQRKTQSRLARWLPQLSCQSWTLLSWQPYRWQRSTARLSPPNM